MLLSLSEAARLLGKSDRQVRYLIRMGKLAARKEDGAWVIRREDLPLSPGQEKAVRQKSERALDLALDLLDPDTTKDKKKSYSIRQMRAFQEGAPLYHDLAGQLGAEHPAALLLRETLTSATGSPGRVTISVPRQRAVSVASCQGWSCVGIASIFGEPWRRGGGL